MNYDLGDVKARADLASEVASRVGAGRARQGTVTFRCPNPSHEDRNPSFTVDVAHQRFRCWSLCDRGGDVIDLVVWLDGLTIAEAVTWLGDKYGAHQDTKKPPSHSPPTKPASRPKLVAQSTDNSRPHPQADAALSTFLEARGWSHEVAHQVGLSVIRDQQGHTRVRFPFHTDGVAKMWQDRATDPRVSPKWRTPREATLYPFGVDCLLRYDSGEANWPHCPILGGAAAVWLVEGPADAVTLLNVWPAVSVLGIPGAGSWGQPWAKGLDSIPVVVVTDNDEAGQSLRDKLTGTLEGWTVPIHVYVPAAYNDLSDWYLAVGRERFTDDLAQAADTAARADEVLAP